MPKRTTKQNDKPVTTAQKLGSVVKSARDIMRTDKGLNGELDRLPQLTWIMFLKLLDDNDGMIEQAEEFITDEGLKNSSAKIYPKGTLVIALYGATVGKLGILGIDAASNQAVCAVKPKTNKISTNFLFWFLRYKRQDFLNDSFGGAQPNISQKILRETCLPLPNKELQENICDFLKVVKQRQNGEKHLELPKLPTLLEEQRRIVVRVEELVGKVEEVRSLRQKALEESEALTKAAMRQIFKPHENYQEVSLESVCAAIIDNLHSNPVYSDNGVPCIRSSDVGWGALYLDTARCTSEEEYKQRTVRGEPIPNDIVLVREGGGTGKAAIVLEGQRFSLGQRVMMLRPDKNKVIPKFFLYQILSPSVYEDQIIPRCKGSASPHLNIGALRKFNFFLPPLPKQHRIVNYLDELQTKVDTMKRMREQTIKELDALLPSILDKAFKGEL